MTPRVTAIVLNWNNAPDTLACLASLAQQGYPHRVLVVDNGSTDDSVARIGAAYPEVELLETGANLGYAGGNNAGIRHALEQGADYLFILNNDVTLDPACLRELVRAAAADPRAGILGPLVLDAETPDRVQSAGMRVDFYRGVQHLGAGQHDAGVDKDVVPVEAIKGCAMLVASDCIEAAGMLDARFFMYLEEVDWCLRARKAAYHVLFAPSARVWHRETEAEDQRYIRAAYYMTRNMYLLALSCSTWTSRARLLLRDAIWVANWTLNPKWRARRPVRDAVVLGVADAFRGNWGRNARWHGE
jgi:hypothetical protein